MTVKEVIEYFKNAEDHYHKAADKFVSDGYHQSENTGYMKYAKSLGLTIDAEKAEPNQKWHLLESYIQLALDDEKNSMTLETPFSKRYCRLSCPELLLWIAEAAGVDDQKVEQASEAAKSVIDNNTYKRPRVSACSKIRKIIPWSEIVKSIENHT